MIAISIACLLIRYHRCLCTSFYLTALSSSSSPHERMNSSHSDRGIGLSDGRTDGRTNCRRALILSLYQLRSSLSHSLVLRFPPPLPHTHPGSRSPTSCPLKVHDSITPSHHNHHNITHPIYCIHYYYYIRIRFRFRTASDHSAPGAEGSNDYPPSYSNTYKLHVILLYYLTIVAGFDFESPARLLYLLYCSIDPTGISPRPRASVCAVRIRVLSRTPHWHTRYHAAIC